MEHSLRRLTTRKRGVFSEARVRTLQPIEEPRCPDAPRRREIPEERHDQQAHPPPERCQQRHSDPGTGIQRKHTTPDSPAQLSFGDPSPASTRYIPSRNGRACECEGVAVRSRVRGHTRGTRQPRLRGLAPGAGGNPPSHSSAYTPRSASSIAAQGNRPRHFSCLSALKHRHDALDSSRWPRVNNATMRVN